MNDEMLMNNYLLLLKSTVEVYVHGTLESANAKVHNLLKKSLDNTMSMQKNTYDEMTNYGWYTIEDVKKTVIDQTINKINNN